MKYALGALGLALSLPVLPLQAEVNLEALSKKISQWPREITLTQDVKLNLKQPDGSVKPAKIASGAKLEVVSIQPNGIEVRLPQANIILPAAVTDLEVRLSQVKPVKPAPTAANPKTGPASKTPVDPEAVRKRFGEAIKDEVLTLQELDSFSAEEIAVMPENIQQHIANLRKSLEDDKGPPGQPTKAERPKPVLQSREMTPFIKELMTNLEILENQNIKPYTNTISIKDKDYYLLIIGSANDEKTKPILPEVIDFYTRVNRVSKKYEIIYFPVDRTPQGMEAFVKEMKMPWPILSHQAVKNNSAFGKYAKWGVPNLVVVDRAGEMISNANREDNKSYDSREVLSDLASLLQIPPTVYK